MIEWNTIKYIDCMDKEKGLPSLPDKSIDLCLTDPPWIVNYEGRTKRAIRKTSISNIRNIQRVLYNDSIPINWHLRWFSEIIRICNGIIINVGRKQLSWWYKNTDPIDIFILYFRNGASQSKISKWNCLSPFLFYGDYFVKNKLHHNVWETFITSGFLRNKNFIHPSPKEVKIYSKFLEELKPNSVIDPFLGSGTTAEACIKLGIKFVGYEINEVYSKDINKRIRNCKKQPQQIKLQV